MRSLLPRILAALEHDGELLDLPPEKWVSLPVTAASRRALAADVLEREARTKEIILDALACHASGGLCVSCRAQLTAVLGEIARDTSPGAEARRRALEVEP